MKALKAVLFLLALAMVPACFYDSAIGVRQDASGKVTIDPSGGPAGQLISTAQQAAPFIPQPWGGILTVGLGILSAGVHVLQGIRGRNWKAAALATAQGVNDLVHNLDTHPSPVPILPGALADQLKAAVDAAHDGAGVPQAIQNALSSKT